MILPKQITITEVGPRDGLQNEKEILPTETKVKFIDQLTEAGFSQIEVGSFVSPKWVPQMADTAEIYLRIQKKAGVRYITLVPNQKGMENALACQVTSIAVFTAASESFTKKNINKTIEESLKEIREITKIARINKIWVRGYISTCFGCPYEGKIDPQKVIEVANKLLELDIDELSIGDTIGVAVPTQVESLISLLSKKIPLEKMALHFHDTRGTALANVLAGLQSGILKFDSSAGGLGGCPYAPGAAGNLATEDLVYMLNEMKIETHIDQEKLVNASKEISQNLNRILPGRYLQSIYRSK